MDSQTAICIVCQGLRVNIQPFPLHLRNIPNVNQHAMINFGKLKLKRRR